VVSATLRVMATPFWDLDRLREMLDRCDLAMEDRAAIEQRLSGLALEARELAYTGIGIGILGFQRAQVLRREYQPAIEEFWTEIRSHLR
jgi:hypothetical protein